MSDAVSSEGPKTTGIQQRSSALSLTHRDLSSFSESFDDVMHCRWWDLQSLCNLTLRSIVFKVFHNLFTHSFHRLEILCPSLLLRDSASLMPSSHCMILARFFTRRTGFDKLPTNARDRRQIGARSSEWQSRSVNYQRRDLRESPMCRRCPWNIWHAKYLELSAILNPAVWMSSDRFWLKNTLAMTYSQWESKIHGSWKFEEVFFIYFFIYFFTKRALEYTEQVGYMKMKKG